MTHEEFEKIMNDDSIKIEFPVGNNALAGLNLIAKYLPKSGIGGAGHDQIWGTGIGKIVNAGITKEDTVLLKKWNWMIDEDSLSCFV